MDPLICTFERFMADVDGLRPATVYQYTRSIARLDRWLGDQGLALDGMTPELVDAFLNRWLHEQGCNRRSRNQYLYAFKRFFPWLWKRLGRDPETHPAKTFERWKFGRSLPKSMALKHADAILSQQDLDTFVGIRDTAMIMLMVGCGLRVSELVGLNEEDLIWTPDPEGGMDWLDLRVMGKGGHERIASAPKEVSAAIRAYLGHPDLKPIDRWVDGNKRVLFVSVRSKYPAHEYVGEKRRMSRYAFYWMLAAYGKRAKVPIDELHPHALRHLYACHLLEKGVDLYEIKELMGHQSVKSTEIYLQITAGRRRKTVSTKTPLASINTMFRRLIDKTESKSRR